MSGKVLYFTLMKHYPGQRILCFFAKKVLFKRKSSVLCIVVSAKDNIFLHRKLNHL